MHYVLITRARCCDPSNPPEEEIIMKRVALVLTLLALLAPAALVVAAAENPTQNPPAAEATKNVVGELKQIDPALKTFALEVDEKTQSFVLGPRCAVTAQGKPIQFAELKPGQELKVTFQMSGANATATRIEVIS